MKILTFLKIILYTLYLFSLSSHAYLLFISSDQKLYTSPNSVTEWSQHPLSIQHPEVKFIEATYGTPDTNYPEMLFILGYDLDKERPVVFYSTDGISFNASLVPFAFLNKYVIADINTALSKNRLHIGINNYNITVYGQESTYARTRSFSLIGSVYHTQHQYHIDQWQNNTSLIDNMVSQDTQCRLLKTGMTSTQSYRYVLVKSHTGYKRKTKYLNVYTSNLSNFDSPQCLMSVNVTDDSIVNFNMQIDSKGSVKLFKQSSSIDKWHQGLFCYTPIRDTPNESEVMLPHLSFCNRYIFSSKAALFSRKKQVFLVEYLDKAQFAIASAKAGADLDTLKIVHPIDLPEGIQHIKGQFLHVSGKYLLILTGIDTSKRPIQPIVLQSKDASSWKDISANVTLPPNVEAKTTFYIPDVLKKPKKVGIKVKQ